MIGPSTSVRRRMRRFLPGYGPFLGLMAALGTAGSVQAQGEPGRPAEQWAVLIAAQDYESPAIPDLRVPLADVRGLRRTLVERAGVADDHILQMADDSGPGLRPTFANLTTRLPKFLHEIRPGDSLLFFFSGHGLLIDGKPHLVPIDADPKAPDTFLKAGTLGVYLNGCPATTKFLILDCCLDTGGRALPGGKSVQPNPIATGPARPAEGGRAVPRNSFVVLESCRDGQSSWEWPERNQSVFTYWLRRALEGAADADGDGRLTATEVANYTHEHVPLTIRALNHPEQTPARELSREIDGDPPLLSLRPEPVDDLSRRMAALLDEEVRLRKYPSVGVPKEFRVKVAGARAGLARYPLPGLLARSIGDELARLAPTEPGAYRVDRDASAADCRPGPPSASVVGDLSVSDAAMGVQCELFAAEGGSVARLGGRLKLDEALAAEIGRSLDNRPPERPPGPPQPAPPVDLARPQVAVWAEDFPFRVELLSADGRPGAAVDASTRWRPKVPRENAVPNDPAARALDPRLRIVGARDGEVFKVRLTNRSDRRVGVVLRIDGVNTLGKAAETAEAGRPWVLEPGGSTEIEGFSIPRAAANAPGEAGAFELQRFRFENVPQDEGSRRDPAESLGLITAAFFAEDTSRALRVVGGQKEARTFTTAEFRRKGRLLAVVQVGYEDERLLEK